jgi:hypothetical protein
MTKSHNESGVWSDGTSDPEIFLGGTLSMNPGSRLHILSMKVGAAPRSAEAKGPTVSGPNRTLRRRRYRSSLPCPRCPSAVQAASREVRRRGSVTC